MTTPNTGIEELRSRMEALRTELYQAEAEVYEVECLARATKRQGERGEVVRRLEDVSVDEKVAYFDAAYKAALEDLEEAEADGGMGDEGHYFAWQHQMETLAFPGRTRELWAYCDAFEG